MKLAKVTAYQDSVGVLHTTIEGWQQAELLALFTAEGESETAAVWNARSIAEKALAEAEALLSILTTGPRSRPKARKAAGTTNPKRAAKGPAAKASAPAPELAIV